MYFALQAVTVELSEKDVIVKAVDTSQVTVSLIFIHSSHNKSSSLAIVPSGVQLATSPIDNGYR